MSLKDHREDILAAFTLALDHAINAAEDRPPHDFQADLTFTFETPAHRFSLESQSGLDLTQPAKPQLDEMRQPKVYLTARHLYR